MDLLGSRAILVSVETKDLMASPDSMDNQDSVEIQVPLVIPVILVYLASMV